MDPRDALPHPHRVLCTDVDAECDKLAQYPAERRTVGRQHCHTGCPSTFVENVHTIDVPCEIIFKSTASNKVPYLRDTIIFLKRGAR